MFNPSRAPAAAPNRPLRPTRFYTGLAVKLGCVGFRTARPAVRALGSGEAPWATTRRAGTGRRRKRGGLLLRLRPPTARTIQSRASLANPLENLEAPVAGGTAVFVEWHAVSPSVDSSSCEPLASARIRVQRRCSISSTSAENNVTMSAFARRRRPARCCAGHPTLRSDRALCGGTRSPSRPPPTPSDARDPEAPARRRSRPAGPPAL
jgi:hypothetical protein